MRLNSLDLRQPRSASLPLGREKQWLSPGGVPLFNTRERAPARPNDRRAAPANVARVFVGSPPPQIGNKIIFFSSCWWKSVACTRGSQMRWDGVTRSRTYFLQRLVELRSITAADKIAWRDWIHHERSSPECFCLGFATSLSAGGVALLIMGLVSSGDISGNAPWSISKAHAALSTVGFRNEPGPVYAPDLTSPLKQIIIRRESITAARVPTHDATSHERQVWWGLPSSVVEAHQTGNFGPPEPQR